MLRQEATLHRPDDNSPYTPSLPRHPPACRLTGIAPLWGDAGGRG
ncbi:hypothetical protein [Streptomyces sp. NPDC058953]